MQHCVLAAGYSGISCRSQQLDSGLFGELNPFYYAVTFIHTATPPSLTMLPSIRRLVNDFMRFLAEYAAGRYAVFLYHLCINFGVLSLGDKGLGE
jgi:hypothetical protein